MHVDNIIPNMYFVGWAYSATLRDCVSYRQPNLHFIKYPSTPSKQS